YAYMRTHDTLCLPELSVPILRKIVKSCDKHARSETRNGKKVSPSCVVATRDRRGDRRRMSSTPSLGRVPLACGSFPLPENRVQYRHCSTRIRGFCHGLCSLFLPVAAARPGVAVRHAPCPVAKRPRHVSDDTSTPTAKAQPCIQTFCRSHHCTALRRL